MNLGLYINKLLLENDSVIIPGFGAFVSKYKPSEISEGTSKITPPSKEILFNQQIRNNDGLLVEFVAENESLSHFDALKLIETECETIIYHLDKGEKITLEEIGVLFLDEKNEIKFKPHIDKNLLLDSFGLEPVNPFEEIPENTEDKTTENESAENRQDTPEILEKPYETTDIHQDNELIFNESSELSSEDFEEEKTIPEAEPVIDPIHSAEHDVKKKKNRLWYFLLFIPLIIVIILIINNNSKKVKAPESFQNKEITEETPKALPTVDSTQMLVMDSTQNTEPEQNTISILSNDSMKFYLVGGSFKEEENAQKFIDQFDIEGFEPFNMGKIGNFYFVGLGKFNTEQEAYQAKTDFMEKNPSSETWVYEKK